MMPTNNHLVPSYLGLPLVVGGGLGHVETGQLGGLLCLFIPLPGHTAWMEKKRDPRVGGNESQIDGLEAA